MIGDAGTVAEISFDEALDRTKVLRRDILLGNGFSIAAWPKFTYDRILDRASISDDAKAIFVSRRTTNFEEVMRILLAEMQGADPREVVQAQRLIHELKAALVTAIHDVHPSRRWEIPHEKFEHCERFLTHFVGKGRPQLGRVFTTNYDLLLTWVTAPESSRRKPDRLFNAFDGFGYGAYQGLGNASVIYLHGALHLTGSGTSVRKLTYVDTGEALHDQVAKRLDRREFPLFVSEGASTLKRPSQPGYLKEALAKFRFTCRAASGTALFTLGHGLGPEDNHILSLVPASRIPSVYLGAFRQAEVEAFKAIGASWKAERERAGGPPLEVFVFDSEGVAWGR